MNDLDWWRMFSVLFVALGQTLFVAFYSTLPWWRTFLGRMLFIKALSFFLFVNSAVLVTFFEMKGEDELLVGLYVLVGVGTWGQLIAFIKQGRHRPPPLDKEKPAT